MNKLITLFHRFTVTKVTMMILIRIQILSCLLIKQNHFFPSIIPSSTSSSTSSSSSASSINDSSNSSSDREVENVDLFQNPASSAIHEQESITQEKKGKKRVRTPSMWRTNVSKVLRNSGKAYHCSSKSKKEVPERKMRSPCGDNCQLSCKNNFDEPTRLQLFNAYWKLADLQRQREFIVRHAQEINPKYRYSSTQNLRALNTSFYFKINGSKIRVCKTFSNPLLI